MIGTMRSDSRIASSTLLVIMTDGHRPLGGRAELREVLLQRLARQRVERAERLVQKQHLRPGRTRARWRRAAASA